MALFDSIRLGASGAVDFEVDRSLRFDPSDATYLTRTPSSTGNRRTFTFSFWFKRGKADANGTIWQQRANSNSSRQFSISIRNGENLRVLAQEASTGQNRILKDTNRVLRDPTAWYHLVIAVDTEQSTADDRVKIYVNGVQHTNFDVNNLNPVQDLQLSTNHASKRILMGVQRPNSSSGLNNYFDGYMSQFHLIDGLQLTPSSFAETNSVTGQWVPKEYEGAFGTNGYLLDFSDNSSVSALGTDASGNGHNFTANNFSVSAGIGNDSVIDTPTNNFCTYNDLNKSNNVTLSEGNLKFTQSSNDRAVTGTMAMTSGKYYYEFLKVSGDNPEVGILPTDSPNPATNGQIVRFSNTNSADITGFKIAFITNNGQQRNGIDYGDSGAITLTGGSAQTGAGYIGIAIDMDNKKIWYTDLSGNYFNSGNPANGTNAAYDFSSTQAANGAVPFVYFATASNDTGSVNFGQQPFNYTQPSGFKSICSQNLPSCAASPSNKYFDALLYTGNGSTNTISGLNFSPDWVWGKTRNTSAVHYMFDQVRGTNKYLDTQTDGETTNQTDLLTAFNSDGFTLGANSGSKQVNKNGNTYVAWNWFAGGSTATNNDGSISSQVRASTTAGFSICTWTGTGSNGSIGHGLGVTPNFCLMKRRDTGGNNWIAASFDMQSARELNTSNPFSDGDYDAFFPSQPTSSVINMATDSNNNTSGGTYVGYIFSSVQGFSKYGIFGGNGSSDGTYVDLGFRPAFLIIKRTDSGNHWVMYDAVRSTTNVVDEYLRSDTSDSENESSQVRVDFLATGFKMRSGFDIVNAGSGIYFYWAVAEAPFKFARAR